VFIMTPSAFASAHHENLPDELTVLEYKIQVGFADVIDIAAAESTVGSYFVVVLMPAFEFVVVL
jgi:hypothetical protein